MEIASKRRVTSVGAWAVVAFVTVGLASPAGAAAKKTTNVPVAVTGAACSPQGARDPGTALDCVAVGKGLQWQPKGSRANPLLIGEAGEIQIYDAPPNRYRFKVLSVKADATADVPLDPGKKPVPADVRFVMISAELTFLGDGAVGDPSVYGYWELVDAKDKAYGLYGDSECEQYGTTPSPLSLRNAALNAPSSGNLCGAVAVASIGPTLLLRVRGLSGKAIWFRPIP